jgi:hypothetical protein
MCAKGGKRPNFENSREQRNVYERREKERLRFSCGEGMEHSGINESPMVNLDVVAPPLCSATEFSFFFLVIGRFALARRTLGFWSH